MYLYLKVNYHLFQFQRFSVKNLNDKLSIARQTTMAKKHKSIKGSLIDIDDSKEEQSSSQH